MDAYRTPEPPVDGSVEQSFVNAVLIGRVDAMEYFFERIPSPQRQLPRSHLFNRASPRVTICWRPSRGDFILSWIAREALAGAWRVSLDSDVLGYAFDEHVSWVREPTSDELAFLRGARILL